MSLKHFTSHFQGEERIVGGNATAEGEIPWQCALLKSNGAWSGCGAVLLHCNPTIVLTAAHCFPTQGRSYKVSCGGHKVNRYGSTPLGRYEERLNVKEVVKHPNYNPRTSEHDIALLKVYGQFDCQKKKMYPACLPRRDSTSTKGLVTGWGVTQENGQISETLLKARVPVVSDDTCKKAYGSYLYPESMICAGKDGVDACQGKEDAYIY